MKYEYLLFDLDGTLTYPKEGITKCAQYALRHFGIDEPDLDKLEFFIGPPLTVTFGEVYGFDEDKQNEAVKKYRERYNTIGLYENEPIPNVDKMLEILKNAGYKLAVATSKPEPTAIKVLEKFGLTNYFEVITGSEFDGRRNSKDLVIIETLERLGINSENKSKAVMIGDRKHDIIGAKKCGLDSIGLYVGYAPRGELEQFGADYVFEDFGGLVKFLTGKEL